MPTQLHATPGAGGRGAGGFVGQRGSRAVAR